MWPLNQEEIKENIYYPCQWSQHSLPSSICLSFWFLYNRAAAPSQVKKAYYGFRIWIRLPSESTDRHESQSRKSGEQKTHFALLFSKTPISNPSKWQFNPRHSGSPFFVDGIILITHTARHKGDSGFQECPEAWSRCLRPNPQGSLATQALLVLGFSANWGGVNWLGA